MDTMSCRSFFLASFILFSAVIYSQNSHPIILLHGFLGWGRNEMSDYYYWGGQRDLQADLIRSGYDVHTVSVGPISPNWDRAIEAFYQIKGGQVDYGNEKALKYNIIQRPFGKNYNGFYPQWDAEHPIHIISHSQGGQTARLLELLLKESYEGENSTLLANEYNGWITSITTISTPHNGSTLVPIMLDIFPFAPSLAPWFGGIDNNALDNFYNFDLEHWGLEKKVGESTNNYFKRLSESPVSESKNLCTWDLTPQGSLEFNKEYTTDEDVYYFSYITYASVKRKNSHFHKPNKKMSFHLWPTSLLMGKYENVDSVNWYENDGIVNSISMSHPSGSKVMDFDGYPIMGTWQAMERLNMDHQAIIGHHISKKQYEDIFVLYNQHCQLLYSLK